MKIADRGSRIENREPPHSFDPRSAIRDPRSAIFDLRSSIFDLLCVSVPLWFKGVPLMYPSGKWRGWWQQHGFGRQPMEEFELRFANGAIEGRGRDVVGIFVFQGTCSDGGTVRMLKQYLGRHQVVYEGTYDGEGTIAGTWSIPPFWSGPFAISPVTERPTPEAHIVTL
jgi:hypothetical protein